VDKIEEEHDEVFFPLVGHIRKNYGGEATFPHFVNYLLNSSEFKTKCTLEDCVSLDYHWKPFYDQCGFCNVDFDVIGQMESFEDDVK
jgi:hypothetical protein